MNDKFELTSSVPILIDDGNQNTGKDFIRGIFFTIESNQALPNWYLDYNEITIPFLMLGLKGIICHPIQNPNDKNLKIFFDTSNEIDNLFNTIESSDGVLISQDFIILPSDLFNKNPKRNDVFRINKPLFNYTYKFTNGDLSEDYFDNSNIDYKQSFNYSEIETKSFWDWGKGIIEETKIIYKERRKEKLGKNEDTDYKS